LYEILSAILNEYTEWDRNALHPSSVRDSLVAALGDAQYVAPVVRVANDVEDVGGRPFFMLLEHHIRDANYPQVLNRTKATMRLGTCF
jgi:neuroligin